MNQFLQNSDVFPLFDLAPYLQVYMIDFLVVTRHVGGERGACLFLAYDYQGLPFQCMRCKNIISGTLFL
jgi:hypothetical protein